MDGVTGPAFLDTVLHEIPCSVLQPIEKELRLPEGLLSRSVASHPPDGAYDSQTMSTLDMVEQNLRTSQADCRLAFCRCVLRFSRHATLRMLWHDSFRAIVM